jgi:hypothetical protein
VRFFRLATDRKSTRLEQHLDKRLQPLRSWVLDTSFPILNCASTNPHAGRQVTLAETCPSAVA